MRGLLETAIFTTSYYPISLYPSPKIQNVTLRGDLDPNYTFTSVHINSVGCSGEEKSLSECSHQLVNQRLANTRSLAGVKCAGKSKLIIKILRLKSVQWNIKIMDTFANH